MRRSLTVYVAAIVALACALFVRELLPPSTPQPGSALAAWPHAWSVNLALALLLLTILGEHLQFEIRRGWNTNCSAVAHLAAAFLLPPPLAMAIAALGALTRAMRYPLPPTKLMFNAASIAIAVLAAAHVVAPLGGPDLVRSGGAWSDPLAAILASGTYYALSAAMVAFAVALDQRRPFLDVIRGTLGFKSFSEVGLGMVGALLATMLSSAPNWAPMVAIPAGLLYFAKRSLDRADRRSRNLAVTSSVGRAVAGTLDPERAFAAIATPPVLEGLKLDGLGVLPIGDPPGFGEQVLATSDRPHLRAALVQELSMHPRLLEIHGGGARAPKWLVEDGDRTPVAAVAIPFGAGATRAVGALVAWRDLRRGQRAFLNQEELLVLKTLADYASGRLRDGAAGARDGPFAP